jgi:protein tyrosine phosphatase (PTP) superfamily phosphohydrolase (DUF442 family)
MGTSALEAIVRYVPVSQSLATAGQPSEAQLAAIAEAGFEVVINLALHNDPRYSLKDEATTVVNLGMEYIHIPVPFASPTAENLESFFAAMERVGQHKVFVHCAQNKRVPVFIALHRIIKQGWAEDKAVAAMHDVWQPDATWESFIASALAKHGG